MKDQKLRDNNMWVITKREVRITDYLPWVFVVVVVCLFVCFFVDVVCWCHHLRRVFVFVCLFLVRIWFCWCCCCVAHFCVFFYLVLFYCVFFKNKYIKRINCFVIRIEDSILEWPVLLSLFAFLNRFTLTLTSNDEDYVNFDMIDEKLWGKGFKGQILVN